MLRCLGCRRVERRCGLHLQLSGKDRQASAQGTGGRAGLAACNCALTAAHQCQSCECSCQGFASHGRPGQRWLGLRHLLRRPLCAPWLWWVDPGGAACTGLSLRQPRRHACAFRHCSLLDQCSAGYRLRVQHEGRATPRCMPPDTRSALLEAPLPHRNGPAGFLKRLEHVASQAKERRTWLLGT